MKYKTVKLGDYLYIKGRIGWKGLKKSEYLNGGEYRIINAESLTRDGIDWSKAGYITKDRYEESPEIMLKKDDILISKDGTIGKIGYVENVEKPTSVASGIFVLRNLNNTIINTRFIYHYLGSSYFRNFILSRTEGSVIPHLYQKDFVTLDFPLPEIDTQNKIVNILDAISHKISVNKQINNNLEQQAQAIFKSWFVDFEPFNGTMPSDWEIVPLEKIANFQNGYAFKSKELLNEPSPDCYQVFKQGHIARGGGFILEGTKSWYPKKLSSKLEKFVLKKGDILMAMTDMKDNVAILGNTAIMPIDNEYIVNQRVGHLRANGYKGITYPFIYLLTNSTDFLIDLRSRANSGVQVNLSSSEIKDSQTVLPSEKVNKAFSEIVLPMFEAIISNQLENQRLSQLRDALLPKLMSGEIDVSDIEL